MTYTARGKLLLTAEYLVLDGATALAVPTRPGQQLTALADQEQPNILWTALDEEQNAWFEATLEAGTYRPLESSDFRLAQRLEKLLQRCRHYNFDFLPTDTGYRVTTELDFPRDWGLGTSSTLVHCLARWAEIDPFKLQFDVFGGSGYDVACASATTPLLYQLRRKTPNFVALPWQPEFHRQLYFVYQERKQNSREAIQRYRELELGTRYVAEVNELTNYFLRARTLTEFQQAMQEHENLIGKILQLDPVQWRFFSDFPGQLKSLGAWGGDFLLVADERPEPVVREYFRSRGYSIFLKWGELLG